MSSLPLLPSHSLPLLQCGVPPHRRQFSMSYSNMSPSHGLQLFINCPSVGPSHGVESFRNRLLQCGSPTGSQALPANLLQRGLLSPQVCRSCQEPAPAWAPHGVNSLLRASPCSSVGPSMGCRWRSAPLWTSMGCRGSLTHQCLLHRCRGTSTLAPGASPPPPSALALVSAGLFLTSSHSCHLAAAGFFFLLNYVIPEALPPSLMGSALASGGSILEPASIGSIRLM